MKHPINLTALAIVLFLVHFVAVMAMVGRMQSLKGARRLSDYLRTHYLSGILATAVAYGIELYLLMKI